MTVPLLAIDCVTLRVRRYQARRVGGTLHVLDEVSLIPSTHPDFDLPNVLLQLEQFRQGAPVVLRDEAFPQDHIPQGAA